MIDRYSLTARSHHKSERLANRTLIKRDADANIALTEFISVGATQATTALAPMNSSLDKQHQSQRVSVNAIKPRS